MAEHAEEAAEVLAHSLGGRMTGAALATSALDALSVAGLAVVRVGEVPPWMEQPRDVNYGGLWLLDRDSSGVHTVMSDDASDIPERLNPRPLYVLKENQ